MLVPTTGGDNYHTARRNELTRDKNKHATLTTQCIEHDISTEKN